MVRNVLSQSSAYEHNCIQSGELQNYVALTTLNDASIETLENMLQSC